MTSTLASLIQQRSMLVIPIAACQTARTAFEAADNAVDATLSADLSTMIVRSESELAKINQRLHSLT